MISAGQAAPDPEVFTAPGERRRLSELRGGRPSVLLFFPLAFSGVCTRELCSVSEDLNAWNDVGARVIALSVDSPYTNRQFADACRASYPVVSDFNREATRAFGVERPDLNGLRSVSERAVFVIDADGIVRYTWMGEHPGVFPPLEEVRSFVQSLV